MSEGCSCNCQGRCEGLNTLVFDEQKCINCGRCSEVCPHAVFRPGEDHVILAYYEACMECGACQMNCPVDAISVESGVGCAYAMIKAALLRKKEVTCGDGDCC